MISAFSSLSRTVSAYVSAADDPLVVLVGPTASGKTSLSIDVARSLSPQAEVINADSRQMYRGFDIGTAKITEAEKRGVTHHLIDTLDPADEYTAARFRDDVLRCAADIRSRGAVPILVGGSMLYVSALIDGLTMAPPKDPELRVRLEAEYDRDGGKALHAKLTEIDPVSAAEAHPNNKPRVVRAMEIYALTGKPKSEAVPPGELRTGAHQTDALLLLLTRERTVLNGRIEQRCLQMFLEGWMEEVRALLDAGVSPDSPAMKSQGYREIARFLTEGVPETTEELQRDIIAKTKRFARRQATWWRNDPRMVVIDGDAVCD